MRWFRNITTGEYTQMEEWQDGFSIPIVHTDDKGDFVLKKDEELNVYKQYLS